MFLAGNLPFTLYFAKNARQEIKANRQLEQLYLLSVEKYGSDEITGLDAAMMAMRGNDSKTRRVAMSNLPPQLEQ